MFYVSSLTSISSSGAYLVSNDWSPFVTNPSQTKVLNMEMMVLLA